MKYITSQLPLSIGFLSGYLLNKNIGVTIIDEQIKQTSEDELREIISNNQIKVVGLTVLTLTANRTYELSAMIRKISDEIIIIMGGIHASLLPDEPLENSSADIVVRGEGEATLGELLNRIFAGEAYDDVEGISLKKNGAVFHNPSRPVIENLDVLPLFPYHLFEEHKSAYQFGNIMASRGCPYSCLYCSQLKMNERKYRSRSPHMVVKEMEILVEKYKQDFIFFNDDNFIVNKKITYQLCDLIIDKKFPADLKLGINARADSVDPKLLKRLQEAHFTTILFGLESGSDRILKMVNKCETVKQIEDGVRMAKEAGFVVGGQFILGFPTETREESLATIKHGLRIPVDFTRFNLLVPYPGSEIFNMIQRDKDQIVKDKNWSNYATHSGLTGKRIPYIPEGRTAEELLKLQWRANLLFYLRPRQISRIRFMRYAMANQVVFPDPTTVRGFFELAGFLIYIVFYFLINALRRVASIKKL